MDRYSFNVTDFHCLLFAGFAGALPIILATLKTSKTEGVEWLGGDSDVILKIIDGAARIGHYGGEIKITPSQERPKKQE